MYKAFNFTFNNDVEELEGYYDNGIELYKRMKTKAKLEVTSFYANSIINVEKLQNECFPSVNAHVFISHSSKDRELAIALAGYLYETFGWKSFIDSCVWGYMGHLLRKIDNTWCRIGGEFKGYSYKARNKSTSNVHTILSIALAKMIDSTECLMFLNTPNSVATKDIIGDSITFSPWICHEIFVASTIRRWKPSRDKKEKKVVLAEDAQLKFAHRLPLDKFDTITLDRLNKLCNKYWNIDYSAEQWLDELYEQYENKI